MMDLVFRMYNIWVSSWEKGMFLLIVRYFLLILLFFLSACTNMPSSGGGATESPSSGSGQDPSTASNHKHDSSRQSPHDHDTSLNGTHDHVDPHGEHRNPKDPKDRNTDTGNESHSHPNGKESNHVHDGGNNGQSSPRDILENNTREEISETPPSSSNSNKSNGNDETQSQQDGKKKQRSHQNHEHSHSNGDNKNESPSRVEAVPKGQRTCPVTGEDLNSMGGPIPVTIRRKTIFVCCKGCVEAVKDDFEKYLEVVHKEIVASEKSRKGLEDNSNLTPHAKKKASETHEH